MITFALFCHILTATVCFFSSALIETNEGPQQISLTVVKPGDNVTLTCSVSQDDSGLSYWYKLNFGYMAETITSGTFDKISLERQFTNSRFSATKVNRKDTVECPGEDKVHWFKGASESHPGIIYHGGIRKREKGRCDYSLSKNKTTPSDAGTYYCAVFTCGEILFGEGTEVEISMFLKSYLFSLIVFYVVLISINARHLKLI
uniref:Ig-like domain-containing protein n=1 Tax=Amphilophus citrinellus TaxID=61819 RepID=A0A3Q0QX97_AMPCI